MPDLLDCPGRDSIEATLATRPTEDWERHLETCPRCQERLERGDPSEESLLRLVREVGRARAPLGPALTHVCQRLNLLTLPSRSDTPEQHDLYFLRQSGRADLLGTLGEYEVQSVIGQGGMGVVLLAFDPALHRPVAIKVLAASIAGSATARRRFAREAKAAAAVCHDHVVTVHGVNESDGLPYLVMQYVPGESLQARIDRTGPLEVTEIVHIGMQSAAGLAAAHAQGLIHRDIKPANLLLENGLPRVKITDFGLARMADDVQLTQDGVVAGTPEYMAPEQARGEALDHRSDLFSLGSVLYTMATGVPPFRGSSAVAVLRQVSDQDPIPIRLRNPEMPAWMETLVMRLMARDPAQRFQSAAEVATLLEGYLAHLRQPITVSAPQLPHRPLPAQTGRQPGRQWRSWGSWAVGLVLLANLGILGSSLLATLLQESPPKLPATFYHDFRGKDKLPDWFEVNGPEAAARMRFEPEGLRITLSGDRVDRDPVGVAMKPALEGDFEITTRYEILELGKPSGGWGAGFELYLTTASETKEALNMVRGARPRTEGIYICSRMTTVDGKRRHQDRAFPTSATTGQLRVSRVGSEAIFAASEGKEDLFRELMRTELGREDLKWLRLAAMTGNSKAPIDLRLIDLRIRSHQQLAAPAALEASGSSPAPGKAGDRQSLYLLLAGGLGATLLVLAGVWFVARRRPNRKPTNAAASTVSAKCPGCGKSLKAKASLAGKKARCPACQQEVTLPATGKS